MVGKTRSRYNWTLFQSKETQHNPIFLANKTKNLILAVSCDQGSESVKPILGAVTMHVYEQLQLTTGVCGFLDLEYEIPSEVVEILRTSDITA